MHRPREWKREEQDQEKAGKRSNWFKKGGNEAVIFVPATLNSQLQRRYQKEIKRQGFKIKVVEKAGVAIKKFLQRSDPFKSRKCERGDCPVCREDGKGPCDRQSVTYDIKCAECNDIYDYIGGKSRSTYTTGKEHMKSLAKKEEGLALWKHCKEKHNSEMQKFEMNVTGSYSNDAMLRQISENVRIDQVPEGSLMNSKNEWNYFRVPRAVVARDHVK